MVTQNSEQFHTPHEFYNVSDFIRDLQAGKFEAAPADSGDDALLNEAFGASVTWVYEGVPHYSPRQQLEGVVTDVRTRRNGERQVLVKSPALNLPKWVKLEDVQFVKNQTAAIA